MRMTAQFKLNTASGRGWSHKDKLVLLPGFLCDETVWQDQIRELSELAVCLSADWGQLDSIIAMAEAVIEAAPPRFSLAGHSMGGRVAFQVCRLAPDRVTRLALMDTGAGPKPAGAAGETEERRRRELLAIARSQGMRAMAMEWLPQMVHPDRMKDPDLVESVVAMLARKTPDDYERQMNALLDRPDAAPHLGEIRAQTLLLAGADDAWSPAARHQEMAAAIPNSSLVVIPRCGHMSTMERPEEVSRAMRAWLQT
jgi:pimeloyl-ACP methyl ester carboxylesterase